MQADHRNTLQAVHHIGATVSDLDRALGIISGHHGTLAANP
jgi:hypothetical protein